MEARFFSLRQVTDRIRHYLTPALAAEFWVRAEISSGRERGAAFYCDLVETDARKQVVAQLRATVWPDELARIRARFRESGVPLTLEDGSLVGVLCRIQFHPRYGLSLAVRDMDPALALGELALRRREILARLTRDGLLERNAARPVPLLPNRIGLVTSRDSAAYRDFVETLIDSRFGFRIELVDVPVQGEGTEARVLEALDLLAGRDVELVVVVRGGGSKVDLAWLDSESLARRVADYPLPVWTGIGHEIDTGVLDHVAHTAFKTPTAVAESLVDRFVTQERRLAHAGERLRSEFENRRRAAKQELLDAQRGLVQGTRKLLELVRLSLRDRAQALRGAVADRIAAARGSMATRRAELRGRSEGAVRVRRERLAGRRAVLDGEARHRLESARREWAVRRSRLQRERILAQLERARGSLADRARLLRAADPATSLAKGFALVYDADAVLLRSAAALQPGDEMVTRFHDGRVVAGVREVLEAPDGEQGTELRGEGPGPGGDPHPPGRLGDPDR